MEIINLRLPCLSTLVLSPVADRRADCERITHQPSENAREYAGRWIAGGAHGGDTQLWEYTVLFNFLLCADNIKCLFVATARGQAIDAARTAQPHIEWFATGLETATAECPFAEHLQNMTQPRTSQPCVFRPQGTAFDDARAAAVLAVTDMQDMVVIDAIQDTHYDFHMLLLKHVLAPGGTFVWRVDTAFVESFTMLIEVLLTMFASVHIATPKKHADFRAHFIVCRDFQPQEITQTQKTQEISPVLLQGLLERWSAQAVSDQYDTHCLAVYFDSQGINTSDAIAANWRACEPVYAITSLLSRVDTVVDS